MVQFAIVGTSNSTGLRFTVPYTINSLMTNQYGSCNYQIDNGSVIGSGAILLNSNTTAVDVSKGVNGNWTASGLKAVYGQLWYQSN